MGGDNPIFASLGKTSSLNDALNSPLLGLSAGLLSAAGPSFQPQSIASGLSRGLGLASEMQRRAQELALRQKEQESLAAVREAQLDKYKQEQQLREQELERQKAFRNLLGSGQSELQPSDSLMERGVSVQQDSPLPPTSASPLTPPSPQKSQTVINEGNPNLYNIDALYQQNPQFRDYFNKMGLKLSRQVKQSPETGQVFYETTYPSGKTVVEAIQVGKSPEARERDKQFA